MSKLTWGSPGERFFETGTDQGVLYVDGQPGVPWNGLISVSQSPSGGETTPYYIDGVKYFIQSAPEEFTATIKAYTYPDAFELCDGTFELANGFKVTQQVRTPFGLSYRTRVGNDIDGTDHGYKLHIVYNAMAKPSSRDYSTQTASSDAVELSWGIETRPEMVVDPFFGTVWGSHFIVDSTKVYPWALEAVENVLYGSDDLVARLPTLSELVNLFVDNALLKITDNGDGTWTAVGPDSNVTLTTSLMAFTDLGVETGLFSPSATTVITPTADDGIFTVSASGLRPSTSVDGIFMNESIEEFQIDWPSAIYIDSISYNVSSL